MRVAASSSHKAKICREYNIQETNTEEEADKWVEMRNEVFGESFQNEEEKLEVVLQNVQNVMSWFSVRKTRPDQVM